MTARTDKQRTIEARLDRLRDRLNNHRTEAQTRSVVNGLIDLLRDVLLADDEPQPMTQRITITLCETCTTPRVCGSEGKCMDRCAEALAKRAT